MGMTDPIADFLTRIRNASKQGHEYVHMLSSHLKLNVALALKAEGFIRDCREVSQGSTKILDVQLKYGENKEPAIQEIKRLSTPGLRRYVKVTKIPKVMSGLGVVILSTSKGVLSDRQARTQRVGGELICSVF